MQLYEEISLFSAKVLLTLNGGEGVNALSNTKTKPVLLVFSSDVLSVSFDTHFLILS